MKILYSFLLLIPFSLYSKSLANTTYGSITVSELISTYDGDTFTVNIDSFPSLIGKRVSIRVKGIDTPEIRGKCEYEKFLARKAKQMTVNLLRNAKKIELRDMKRGKYFRIVADVYVDQKNLAKELIKQGLAVVYYGGKKSNNWCK